MGGAGQAGGDAARLEAGEQVALEPVPPLRFTDRYQSCQPW